MSSKVSSTPSFVAPRPKAIPGVFVPDNFGSSDIGWQGLLACGNNTYVMIIDPETVQLVQTLERHKSPVILVKWARENFYHDLMSPFALRIASADVSGQIVIWEATHATILAEFSEGGKSVLDMDWIRHQDASHDLLVALHSSNELILWNADTGTKLWKKSYPEAVLSFSLDPYDIKNIIFRGSNCVLLVNDFSLAKQPTSNGRKFYICSPGSEAGGNSSKKEPGDKRMSKSSQFLKATAKLVKGDFLIGGSDKNHEEAMNHGATSESHHSECLQLIYHKSCRSHLIFVYPREILVMDLMIFQTVATIPLEKSSAGFVQVYSCSQRDMLYCMHENGSITLRSRRQELADPGHHDDPIVTSTYPTLIEAGGFELLAQSDSIRLTRQVRLMGMAVHPASEMLSSVATSDGRIQFWRARTHAVVNGGDEDGDTNSSSSLRLVRTSFGAKLRLNLAETLAPMVGYAEIRKKEEPSPAPTEASGDSSPKQADAELVTLKLVMSGLYMGVLPNPTVLKVCPPLTRRTLNTYRPHAAIGSTKGLLQIWDLGYGQLWREYQVLNCPILGIEWLGHNGIVVFGHAGVVHHATGSPVGRVRNELAHLDIVTGKVTLMRDDKEMESPMEFIRISHQKQYLAIGFKDKPLEIWDARNFTLLRELPTSFARPVTLEWSSVGTSRTAMKKSQSMGAEPLSGHVGDMSPNPLSPTGDSKFTFRQNVFVRENFIFTDQEGNMFLINVEGSMLKEGSKIPPDAAMNRITAIAWKGELMVIGDADGNLVFWNLKAKSSRGLPSHGGPIRKMRFAPGANFYRLLVVHQDGVDIWDAKEIQVVSSARCPRGIARLLDAEWSSSDVPVFLGQDGVVRMMDSEQLNTACSPINDLELMDPILNFSFLPPKVSLTARYLIQHQPWRERYELTCPELGEGFDKIHTRVNKIFELMDHYGLKSALESPSLGPLDRCLATAQLFGDEYEVRFWTLSRHYLSSLATDPLDAGLDILCDASTYRAYQLARLGVLERKRCTNSQTQRCAESLILLGQLDRAVRLLLETPPTSNSYLLDLHRACLLANTSACSNSQSTVKLVATNLISNNCLSEGSQLLCMIGKAADACRYLEIYGEWNTAVWLAKCALGPEDSTEVVKRYASHLSSPQVNQKSLSLLLLVMLGQHGKVLESLYSMRQFQLAARYLEVCRELGLLEETLEMESLSNAIFLEFARSMTNLGNREAASYYCDLAGDKGQLLKKEVEFLLSS